MKNKTNNLYNINDYKKPELRKEIRRLVGNDKQKRNKKSTLEFTTKELNHIRKKQTQKTLTEVFKKGIPMRKKKVEILEGIGKKTKSENLYRGFKKEELQKILKDLKKEGQ